MQLQEHHREAITEFINIGVGKAAQILNDMLETHVDITLPEVALYAFRDLEEVYKNQESHMATIQLCFKGDLEGKSILVFHPESALELVAVLTGEETDSPDINSLMAETLNEVGNILMNGVMGSIANISNQHLDYQIPSYTECPILSVFNDIEIKDNSQVLIIQSCFTIRNYKTEGSIIIFFNVDSLTQLAKNIDEVLAS